jgi:hypothetical protein
MGVPDLKWLATDTLPLAPALGGVRLHEQNGNRYIKWHHLPEFLWDAGLYIRLPREVIFTSPTQSVEDRRRRVLSAPWTDEIAAIMQKAMDRGEVKVCRRMPGALDGQVIGPARR